MRPAILLAAFSLAVQSLAVADEPASWKGVTVLPKLGAVVSVGIEKIRRRSSVCAVEKFWQA